MRKTLIFVMLTVALVACGKTEEPQVAGTPESMPRPAPEIPTEAAPPAPPMARDAPAMAPEAPAPMAPAPAPAAPAMATEAPAPAKPAMTVDGAKKFAASCASCHGVNAQGMGAFPRLVGLTADVVKSRLTDYKAGKKVGAQSAVMMPIAKQLSDAEVSALASHIASLK